MAAPERLSATEMAKLYTNYNLAQLALAKAEADMAELRLKAVELRKEIAAFDAQIKSASRNWSE